MSGKIRIPQSCCREGGQPRRLCNDMLPLNTDKQHRQHLCLRLSGQLGSLPNLQIHLSGPPRPRLLLLVGANQPN